MGRKKLVRGILAVAVIAALLLAALLATVGSLNREVYSASGFVRQYLDALARHDTVGALSLPGVRPSGAGGAAGKLPGTLLRASALRSLTDIRLQSDTETAPGKHTVVYEFRLAGESKSESMKFQVAHTGTFAGVFDSWEFSKSPLATLEVTVLHEDTFTVNDITLDTRAQAADDTPARFSNEASYLAFAPGTYEFSHHSDLLTAGPERTTVTTSGTSKVTVDAMPNDTFIKEVQTQLNTFLDKCATEQVLQPTDCPFGIDINDRVKGLPVWSIAEYPEVSLTAGDSNFDMPVTPAQAHIVVEVQSLFDGEVSTRDEDVPFDVSLSVTVRADGSLAIQLH